MEFNYQETAIIPTRILSEFFMFKPGYTAKRTAKWPTILSIYQQGCITNEFHPADLKRTTNRLNLFTERFGRKLYAIYEIRI